MLLRASYVVRYQAVLLALAAPLVTGCYAYTAAQPGAVAPGVTVRARITPAAGESVAPVLGTKQQVLTGKLISNARDTLILEVPAVMQAEIGSSLQTLHQRVSIPRSEIVFLEIRELDRTRTYGVVGGAAIVVGVLLYKALKGEPGSERLPGGGGTDALVPAYRVIR
ncbi:MAG TPA: hypothetical protein VGQ52_17325 [Gemmatimonadaceae bacterium]|nr:hypothetical protein [Gemmatimonadaceae bacterium]